MTYFTKEQFKQLITALDKFGEYEEWEDAFSDTIRSHKYTSDQIQLKCVYDEHAKNMSICVDISTTDGWKTVTMIEEGSEKVDVYGRDCSFDELINLFPEDDYNEKEWLDML